MVKGLYIHIPFCESICKYCDFPKLVGNRTLQTQYIERLIKELRYYQQEYVSLKTIYIGGGTPTHLDRSLLKSLLEEIQLMTPFTQIDEFTMEANPLDIDQDLIELIKSKGINRLSIGMQSTQPHLLSALGRTHTFEDVKHAVDLAHQMGIANINIDIIYGIPGETLGDIKLDLQNAISMHPSHLSVYSLILEEKTVLYHEVKQGKVHLPDEDTEAEMADVIHSLLIKNHYMQYEISNYSLPNYESRHNLGYWNLDEYIGVGMGAASQLQNRRLKNHSTLKSYMESVDLTSVGTGIIEDFNPIQETLLLGLRKSEGVDMLAFETKFHMKIFEVYPKLERFLTIGLLQEKNHRLMFTKRGMMLSNQVYLELF